MSKGAVLLAPQNMPFTLEAFSARPITALFEFADVSIKSDQGWTAGKTHFRVEVENDRGHVEVTDVNMPHEDLGTSPLNIGLH
jgi:hypothetical protein